MELILTIQTKRSPKAINQLLNEAGIKIPTQIKKGKTKGTIESKLFRFKAEWELHDTTSKHKKPKPGNSQIPP